MGNWGRHASEVYSPPRVTSYAHKLGLTSGFALDLLDNDPFDGQPWDFRIKEKRDRAYAKVKHEKPFLFKGLRHSADPFGGGCGGSGEGCRSVQEPRGGPNGGSRGPTELPTEGPGCPRRFQMGPKWPLGALCGRLGDLPGPS